MRLMGNRGIALLMLISLASAKPAVALQGKPAGAPDIDDGRTALRAGKSAEAISIFLKIPASAKDWVDAQRLLVQAYTTTGKYDDAERVARAGVAAKGGALANTLGEVLLVRGKREAAESAFVRAGAERASDSLTAAFNLATLH